MNMQVGPLRRPGWLALMMTLVVLSGCGQKGPLYREAEAPDAQAAESGQATENADQRDSER
jgi:predicted small lipoprotein YifL